MTTLHIRHMIRSDLPAVLRIEAGSFAHPWDEATFTQCLRTKSVIGMVADQDGRVVGYMLYELHAKRLHVLNFAVAKASRRQGVGTAMVAKLRSKLPLSERNRIVLEVSEVNLPGQLFFKSRGFRAVAVIRDFYDNGCSAYQMALRCSENATITQTTEARR